MLVDERCSKGLDIPAKISRLHLLGLKTFFLPPSHSLTPKPSLNNKAGDRSRYNSRFFFWFLKAPKNHHWDGTMTEENVNIGFHPPDSREDPYSERGLMAGKEQNERQAF